MTTYKTSINLMQTDSEKRSEPMVIAGLLLTH